MNTQWSTEGKICDFQDFMLILDPESTYKWHCNKYSNSNLGCKKEQQADLRFNKKL